MANAYGGIALHSAMRMMYKKEKNEKTNRHYSPIPFKDTALLFTVNLKHEVALQNVPLAPPFFPRPTGYGSGDSIAIVRPGKTRQDPAKVASRTPGTTCPHPAQWPPHPSLLPLLSFSLFSSQLSHRLRSSRTT